MILKRSYFRSPRLFDMMGAVDAKYTRRIVPLFVLCLAGCDRETTTQTTVSTATAPATAAADATGEIVAGVNGRPIYARDVKTLLEGVSGKLTPREALEILIRNKLLAEEARRRGFGTGPEIEVIQKDALARALLISEIGDGITAENIDPDRLQRCYDERKREFNHPALRRVVHFLARTDGNRLPLDEARKLAEKARAAALPATNETDFIQRVKPFTDEGGENVITEQLPPFDSENKQFVQPFVDATFSLSRVGDISMPIQTSFGMHVIFLAEEIPAVHLSLDAVKKETAEACLPKIRREKAGEMMKSLLSRNEIFIYEEALKVGRFPL